jgi:hypothetical protein
LSLLLQFAEFAEVLIPDLLWLGLLAPVCFTLIRVGEAFGLGTTMGINRTFELSLLLAYLISIAVRLCGFHPAPALSESASPQPGGSRILKRPVRDATD